MTRLNSPQVVSTLEHSPDLLWLLRIVVLVQCVGLAGLYFFAGFESESDVYGYLYFDHGWPESVAQRIDDIGVIACLVAGLWVFLAGLGSAPRRMTSLVSLASLVTAFVWFLVVSLAHMIRGEPFASLSLGEHAVRYTVPLALAIIVVHQVWNFRASGTQYRWSMSLLAIASSATFMVHGYKAIVLYPAFTDLILLSDANLLGLGLSQSTSETILATIGIIDIAVALLLIATRWRVIAIYMAVWGLVTSISRLTAFGFAAWPETLIRAANWGAPLALVIYHGKSTTTVSTKDD